MMIRRVMLLIVWCGLILGIMAQPLSAKSVMECGNGVVCSDTVGGILTCCCGVTHGGHQGGNPGSGCIVRSTGSVDYVFQQSVVTVWGWDAIPVVYAVIVEQPEVKGWRGIDERVERPAWELPVAQGLGPRAPPAPIVG